MAAAGTRKDAIAGPGPAERLLASTSGRLALLLGFAAALWLASGLVASALGAFPSLGDALWSGIRHLLDPGSLGDDETAAQRAVGLVQVLAGIVLVVGLALTVLSEVVDRLLRQLGESDPAVHASGHLLVIGDGDALLPILRRLESHRPGASAVVLVPPGDAARRRRLQSRLEAAVPDLAVRALGGDATTANGLGRGSAAAAAAVAILSPADTDDDVADVLAIETGATLAGALAGAGRRPHVGLEMRRGRNVDSIWELFPGNFDAVVHDRVLGALLALAIRNPTFAAMLGADDAAGRPRLAALPATAHAGRTFGELLGLLPDAIPLGLITGGRPVEIRYAPDPATPVAGDQRIVVATGSTAPGPPAGPAAALPPARPQACVTELPAARCLLAGWSGAATSMLEALATMPGATPELTVLAPGPPPGAEATSAATLTPAAGDPRDPADLARAIAASAPEVVLVASAPLDGLGGDAQAALTALHACRILGERDVPVLVEQRHRGGSVSLADADRRIQVISASALAGDAIALAAVDPDALALREALAAQRTDRLLVSGPAGGAVAFADLYRDLLAGGSVPIAAARRGRPTDVTADGRLEAGDELLVVHGGGDPGAGSPGRDG